MEIRFKCWHFRFSYFFWNNYCNLFSGANNAHDSDFSFFSLIKNMNTNHPKRYYNIYYCLSANKMNTHAPNTQLKTQNITKMFKAPSLSQSLPPLLPNNHSPKFFIISLLLKYLHSIFIFSNNLVLVSTYL